MDIEKSKYEKLTKTVLKIEEEVSKHIVGQNDLVRNVIICILAGGNVLLEGVPGLGKTRLVKTLSKVLGINFSRIQFTPDLMPADVIGTNIITKNNKDEGIFKFQPGPIFSNLVLADEINRATPKTQSALLEAMQEQTVTVGNSTYNLPQPFFVMATQNPIEMEGTYPLPEAQLDRFLYKIDVSFPTLEELKDIVKMTSSNDEKELESITTGDEIIELRKIAREIVIAEPVLDYAVRLVLSTHPESEHSFDFVKKYVRFGSSPRGAQAIINTSKIRAILDKRFNVSYDDIRNSAHHALRHRIYLNFEGIAEGFNPDKIISEIIKQLKI